MQSPVGFRRFPDLCRVAVLLLVALSSLHLIPSAHAASAVSLDLRTAGSYGQIGPALFYQNSKKAGTGVIQPFLRVQANSGTAEGYNSSNGSLMVDVKSGAWTHDQFAGPFTTVFTNNIEYYQFFLDINQANSKPYLSLDAVQLWLSSNPINPANSLSTLAAQATKVFDLDDPAYGGLGNEVLLDYSLNSGSGEADMVMLIPKSLFPDPAKYLTLYCKFGAKGGITKKTPDLRNGQWHPGLRMGRWVILCGRIPTATAFRTLENQVWRV